MGQLAGVSSDSRSHKKSQLLIARDTGHQSTPFRHIYYLSCRKVIHFWTGIPGLSVPAQFRHGSTLSPNVRSVSSSVDERLDV
jgi:hypothetical protein